MATATYPSCKVCDRGALIARKKYRMSGPVVFIGFVILIPCILGVLFSAFLFFSSVLSAGSNGAQTRTEAETEMRDHEVPERTIQAVIQGRDSDVEEQMRSEDPFIPEVQKSWIRNAQRKIRENNTGTGLGVIFGGGFAVVTGIASMVGGLLGWLLVMKKRVLQCGTCGAVVNAS